MAERIYVQTYSNSRAAYVNVFAFDRDKDARLASLPSPLKYDKACQKSMQHHPPPDGTNVSFEQLISDDKLRKTADGFANGSRFGTHYYAAGADSAGVNILKVEPRQSGRFFVTLRLPPSLQPAQQPASGSFSPALPPAARPQEAASSTSSAPPPAARPQEEAASSSGSMKRPLEAEEEADSRPPPSMRPPPPPPPPPPPGGPPPLEPPQEDEGGPTPLAAAGGGASSSQGYELGPVDRSYRPLASLAGVGLSAAGRPSLDPQPLEKRQKVAGTLGRQLCGVVSNCVRVAQVKARHPKATIYDVSFGDQDCKEEHALASVKGKQAALERRKMLNFPVLEPLLHALCGKNRWALTGAKLLYVPAALALTNAAREKGWREEEDGKFSADLKLLLNKGEVDSKIALKPTGAEIELAELWQIMAAEQQQNPAEARKPLNVLDVVLTQFAQGRYMQIGDAFFYLGTPQELRESQLRWANLHRITDTLNLHMGYRQSVISSETGPLLQIDRAGLVLMREGMPVLEWIGVKMNRRSNVRPVQPADLFDLARSSKGKLLRSGGQRWKLQQRHSPGVCKRLHGIDEVALKDRTFTQDDGNETNVYKYFVDNYPQFEREIDPNKPGIKVGEAKGDRCAPVVPIELLTFAPGQLATEKTAEVSSEMIKHMAEEPGTRFPAIEDIVRAVSHGEGPTSSAFGIEINPQLLELKPESARQLVPHSLLFKTRGGQSTCDVFVDTRGKGQGGWNLRGGKGGEIEFWEPASLPRDKRWVIVHFGIDLSGLDAFTRTFARMAAGRGMKGLEQPHRDDVYDMSRYEHNKMLADELERLQGKYRGGIGLLMAILPGKEAENARYLYPTIKRWGNTKGVPTQCINGLKMAPPFGKGGGKGGKGGGGGW